MYRFFISKYTEKLKKKKQWREIAPMPPPPSGYASVKEPMLPTPFPVDRRVKNKVGNWGMPLHELSILMAF